MSGNLYRRGKVWWARVQRDSREYRRSLRTVSRAEAIQRLAAWRKELSHAAYYGEERHTWPAAVLKYGTEVLHQSVKAGTAKRYLVSLKALYPILRDLFIDQIDRKQVAKIISERRRQGATNATIKRDLTALSRVLSACCAWGWRDDNPAREFDRSIIREQRDPITLPFDSDIAAVIGLCPGNLAQLVRFALFTGMRQEEIGSLERSQIRRVARICDLTKTKTNRPRSIPLDDRALGTIDGTPVHLTEKAVFWHEATRRSPAGALERTTGRYLNIASRFAAIVAKAVKNKQVSRAFRFHDLRHKYAVDYLRGGGNIYDLKLIMGHSSIKTTEIYLDFLTPEEADNAKRGLAR
jgi:integrase/recombinase XerD